MVKAAKDFAGHLQLTIGLLKKGTFHFTQNLRWSAMACAYAKPLAEVERYTKAANRKRMAREAMMKLIESEQ